MSIWMFFNKSRFYGCRNQDRIGYFTVTGTLDSSIYPQFRKGKGIELKHLKMIKGNGSKRQVV